MIFPVKRLMIENNGYKRDVFLKTIYINSASVVSIVDYDGITEFLLSESSDLQSDPFSLIKFNSAMEDIIVLGTASQIYSTIREHHSGKKVLNG